MTSTSETTTTNNKDDDEAPPENLCRAVRQTCRTWYDGHQATVRIHDPALQQLALEIHKTHRHQQQQLVQWDEEGWHYHPPANWPVALRRERVALYILALDAINFCFWPSRDAADSSIIFEYEHLARALTAAAERDHAQQAQELSTLSGQYAFAANHLQDMTVAQMRDLFATQPPPPNLPQRCALWNQVGRVLRQHFDGSAYQLIQRARGSAVRAVHLLYEYFEGFRDVTSQGVYFLKRAQICVGDWQAALEDEETLFWHNDTDQLTTFADYRLPQLLRQRGVLEYAPDLAQAVDAKEELPAESPAEVSIRASTVVAVDRLVQALNALRQETASGETSSWTAVSVDWYLWQVGERLDATGDLSPHHRVRTIYY